MTDNTGERKVAFWLGKPLYWREPNGKLTAGDDVTMETLLTVIDNMHRTMERDRREYERTRDMLFEML